MLEMHQELFHIIVRRAARAALPISFGFNAAQGFLFPRPA